MIIFVTYSAPNMTKSRDLCVSSAYKNGAENLYSYDDIWIDQDFYNKNKSILDAEFAVNYEPSPRPCHGFWLWKPYFINKVITEAKDGDIVVYADAGVEIISRLEHIVDDMDKNKEDIFLFSNGHQHTHWCKANVMQAINGKQLEVGLQQVQASAMWIRVNDFTRKFIGEWLDWCQVPGMIDDSLSAIPNHPEFASHRYDQAILSCLAHKYGLTLHFWADAKWYAGQRYRWPGDNYPLMFRHHRKRNEEWQ